MYEPRRNGEIDRRIVVWGMAATVAGVTSNLAIPAYAANDEKHTSPSSDEALAALKDGNRRYVSEPQVCTLELAQNRARVAIGQAPWATIISRADSRVPPELVFGGLGLGEPFVARNAGNLVDTATMGTVEYGAAVLGSPLIVVMGHGHCGAVASACDVVTKNGVPARPVRSASLASQLGHCDAGSSDTQTMRCRGWRGR